MTKTVIAALVALCVLAMPAAFSAPASADLADDLARAEREIALRQVARELVANAHDRAAAASQASSLGQKTSATLQDCALIRDTMGSVFERHGIAVGNDGWPRNPKWRRDVPLGATGREIMDEAIALRARLVPLYDECVNIFLTLRDELAAVEAQLFDEFLEDEFDSYVKTLREDEERDFLKLEVVKLTL